MSKETEEKKISKEEVNTEKRAERFYLISGRAKILAAILSLLLSLFLWVTVKVESRESLPEGADPASLSAPADAK